MRKPCIYKITNSINNKIYIGATISFKRRMGEHKYAMNSHKERNKKLYVDMRSYGYENFKKEIIEYCSEEEMFEREKYYIELYNSMDENIGYNQTKGGLGGQTHDISGENNPMYGKHLTEEDKKKLSLMFRGKEVSEETKKKISNGLKGKKKSKKHCENLSRALKGHLPPNTKPYTVINIHTNEILSFVSGAEMERTLKCSRQTIDQNRVTKNGYKKYIKEEDPETIESVS